MKKHTFILAMMVSLFFSCTTEKQKKVIYAPAVFISAIDIEKDNTFHNFQKNYNIPIDLKQDGSTDLLAAKGGDSTYLNIERKMKVVAYLKKISDLNEARKDYHKSLQEIVDHVAKGGPILPPPPPPPPPPSPCNCRTGYLVNQAELLVFKFKEVEGVEVTFGDERPGIKTTSVTNAGFTDISLDFSGMSNPSETVVTINDGNSIQEVNLIFR